MVSLGRLLVCLGGVLMLAGLVVLGLSRLALPWGRLPGDVLVRRGEWTLFAPLGTMVVVSLLLTLGVNLLGWFFRRGG